MERDAGAAGYRYEVMWTVDSLGWTGIPVDQIVSRCVGAAANGVIYLFHVGSASQDFAALPAIVDALRARGFELVTVAQLVGATS